MISERKIKEPLSILQFEINSAILHFRLNGNINLSGKLEVSHKVATYLKQTVLKLT